MRILVVDDSTSTLTFTKKLLETSGYEIETAGNGAAALDKYTTFRPDLVLLDITMPLMDGKETLRRILELDKNANVIMTTAVDDGEIIQGFLARGATGYIVKPFDFEELTTTIRNILNLSKNKSGATFFSLVRNRIEADIRKMVDPAASIVLKKVDVINQERAPEIFTSRRVEQIKVVPQINRNLEFDDIKDYTGYVTEFTGSRIGQVITLVKPNDLDIIRSDLERTLMVKLDQLVDYQDIVEFFNIINQKVITVLSNALQLSFSRMPIRMYDKSQDKVSSWNDVIKATFEIKLSKPVSLNIILCSGRRYQQHS